MTWLCGKDNGKSNEAWAGMRQTIEEQDWAYRSKQTMLLRRRYAHELNAMLSNRMVSRTRKARVEVDAFTP